VRFDVASLTVVFFSCLRAGNDPVDKIGRGVRVCWQADANKWYVGKIVGEKSVPEDKENWVKQHMEYDVLYEADQTNEWENALDLVFL